MRHEKLGRFRGLIDGDFDDGLWRKREDEMGFRVVLKGEV